MKKIWKLCAFLPALFMMGVIFSFSAQTGTQSGSLSHDISVRVVETKGRFFHQELEKKEIEKQADEIEFYIRKAAHMTEYAAGCFWILCQWIPQKMLADGGIYFLCTLCGNR